MTSLSIYIAFTAGLLSFFSPCVFPLVPSYILYIAGITLKDFSARENRAKIFIHSLLFVLGFSVIFISLGATASLLGQLLSQYKETIRIAGGVIVILFGLYIMGVFRLQFLDLERRFSLKTKPAGYLGSFLIGVTFAAAWVPCVGPILGAILVLAGTAESLGSGIMHLIFYSLGLALPFFSTALLLNYALTYFKKIERYLGAVSFISGIFLVMVGILVLTDNFQSITNYLVN